jgi:hypothetical protein
MADSAIFTVAFLAVICVPLVAFILISGDPEQW